MSIPLRHSDPADAVAGARTFFVTTSTWNKQHTLQSDRAATLLIKILYDYRAQGKFRLHDFVIMPDHFHGLLTVPCGMTIERAVQFIKGGFSFRAGKEFGIQSPFWQRGFSEVRILDGERFRPASTYIRQNPVVANLVERPEEFLYSSAHAGYELDPPLTWMRIVSAAVKRSA